MMSSRERKGYSDSRSSTVSPFASMRTTWWTGMRVPLTHACPWQMFGLIEIRSNCTSSSSTSSLLQGRPVVFVRQLVFGGNFGVRLNVIVAAVQTCRATHGDEDFFPAQRQLGGSVGWRADGFQMLRQQLTAEILVVCRYRFGDSRRRVIQHNDAV